MPRVVARGVERSLGQVVEVERFLFELAAQMLGSIQLQQLLHQAQDLVVRPARVDEQLLIELDLAAERRADHHQRRFQIVHQHGRQPRAHGIELFELRIGLAQAQVMLAQVTLHAVQAYLSFHASQYLFGLKGLGHVVTPARLEGLQLVFGVVERGDEDDRHRLQLGNGAQRAARFEAVHVGHGDVEQDAFRRQQLRRFQRPRTRSHRTHSVALIREDF